MRVCSIITKTQLIKTEAKLIPHAYKLLYEFNFLYTTILSLNTKVIINRC